LSHNTTFRSRQLVLDLPKDLVDVLDFHDELIDACSSSVLGIGSGEEILVQTALYMFLN
jgi:hypothetical protein